MSATPPVNTQFRTAELVAFRRLAALAAIATPLFGHMHRTAHPGGVDSMAVRLLLSVVCGVIVLATYASPPTQRLSQLIHATFYAYTAWVIQLLVQNRFHPDYAIGAMVVIAAVSVGFLGRRALLWYLGSTVAALWTISALVPISPPATQANPRLYLSYLTLFCVLAFVVLHGRLLTVEKLEASRLRYWLAARGANDGLWDWDFVRERIYLSPRWKEMLGLREETVPQEPEEWLGRIHPDDRPRVQAELARHLVGEEGHFQSEFRIRHVNGDYRWFVARGLAVRDQTGRAVRIAGSQMDITSRKRAEEQLLHDAMHDPLTGLPNRALFMDRLSQALHHGLRHPETSFAVLFLDVDRFKIVNDSLGHQVGDQFLLAVSQRLEGCLRREDTVARLSGDEFAMIVVGLAGEDDISRVVSRVHEELSGPVRVGGRELVCTVSSGLVLGPGGYQRGDDMIRDADAAMYRAKAQGRGRCVVFDEDMHARTVQLLEMEADLRHALERGELRLMYQPIVSLETQRLTGFEALVRWQHPTKGLLPPLDFIPLAEETGLIVPLGRWVLREACRQLRDWRDHQPPHAERLALNVNASGRELSQPGFVEEVRAALRDNLLEPECLRLEITESVLLGDPDTAEAVLNELRSLGVQLYLDDFGTGYSSFSYLHRFPIQAVKLDRMFVQGVEADTRNAAIVHTLVVLAEALGLRVVAEGVERPEELSHLQKIRCGFGQGFLISRPLNPFDAERLIHGRMPRDTEAHRDRAFLAPSPLA